MDFVDSEDNLQRAIDELEYDYCVCKVPVGRYEIYDLLQKRGFVFCEGMCTLVRDMRPVEIPDSRKALNDSLYLEQMNDSDFERMIQGVSSGMYYLDRISLDPHFTKEQSANRFANWLRQERTNGNEFYKLMCDDEYVGYLDLKRLNDTEYQDVMTGIFPEYRGHGYAMGYTTKLIDMLRDRGVEKVYGDISTNNTPSLQSRLRYGFHIDKIVYVFVKHK